MANLYGERLTLTISGTSHGPRISMYLDGIPAGLPVDTQTLWDFMKRRAPGQNCYSTPRKEADEIHFDSGIHQNHTTGEAILAHIENENARSKDYAQLRTIPRPGHADFTAWQKYGQEFSMAGGGPFSGRMTAAMCIAGGLCKQWLELKGIHIGAHLAQIAQICDDPFDPVAPALDAVCTEFPVLNPQRGRQMQELLVNIRAAGDSVGGIVECAITGLPAGIGGELFAGVESKLAQILYAIPGVKGVEFGLGFAASSHHGSFTNDAFVLQEQKVCMETNHCGGILGGITTGMPVVMRAAFKPTPSIALPQKSVDLQTLEEVTLCVQGRHDPCIALRAVPVVEAAVAIAMYDLLLEQKPNY